MFGRATIRLGIGPHSSFFYFCLPLSFRWSHVQWTDISWLLDLILEGCKPHFKYANGSIRNVLLKHKNTNIAFLCLPSPLLSSPPLPLPLSLFLFSPFPYFPFPPKKIKIWDIWPSCWFCSDWRSGLAVSSFKKYFYFRMYKYRWLK